MQSPNNFPLHAQVPDAQVPGVWAGTDYNSHVTSALSNAYTYITPAFALAALVGTDALNPRHWPRQAILLDGEMRVE